MIAADNPRSDAENVAPHSEAPEKRLNPLWAVNGALAAFLFAAAMYLASR